jgi:hypothetical protein
VAVILSILVAAAFPFRPVLATATPKADFWITNGPVYSTVLSGASLYVGGNFTYVGPDTGPGVTLNTVSGAPDNFPIIEGQVLAAAPDGSGGWYVGGTFTTVDSSPIFNLVHFIPVSPNSTTMIVDSGFTPEISVGSGSASVDTLAVSGTTLYVGGNFDHVDTTTRNNIAAFDITNGTLSAIWDPSADGVVSTLVPSQDGTTLYVGGSFANIGTAARNGIAALNADIATAGDATSWDAGAGAGTTVDAIIVDAGSDRLYFGGSFSSVGAQTRNNLAQVKVSDGSLNMTWDPAPNDQVYTLLLSADGNSLYVGGAFNATTLGTPSIGNGSRDYLAKVLTSGAGAVDAAWNPAPDGAVRAIESIGNSLMLGGDFTTVGGNARAYIANVGTSSGAVTTLDPSSEAVVRVLKRADLPGNTISLFAGGDFNSIGGRVRNRLAALNATTGVASDWNPDVDDGTVYSIAPSASAIFIGGDFTSVGGRARNHFAAIDPTGAAALPDWDLSFDGAVNTLLLSGTTLYAGGAFTRVGSQSRNHLAALDTQAITLKSWKPSVNGDVLSMALSTDTTPILYIGGSFTGINNTTRNFLAALDTSSGALTPWDPDVDVGTKVMAVALSTDTTPVLYVGGDFTHLAGANRNYVAALESDTGSLIGTNRGVAWDPSADNADAPVRALVLSHDNSLLYAGGDFTAVGGLTTRDGVVALTTDLGAGTAWDPAPSTSSTVRALALTQNGQLYVGGDFTKISGALRYQLAVFQPPASKATPGGGAYNITQNVALSCTDKTGSVCTDNILFTTNDSDPVPGVAYSTGVNIPIATTATLRFFAIDSEGMREAINTADYIIDKTPPSVSASPQGGTYTATQNITLTCTDSGGSNCVNIYYTTDGTTPSVASTNYTGAISLDNNADLKFIALDGAGNSSPVMEENFTIDAFSPVTTPSPPPATYTIPQLISLSCDDNGGFGCAGTFYTTDGTTPTTASTPYTQPFLIDRNTSLNYFSIDKAGHQEAVTTAVYLIQTGIVVTSGGGLMLPPLYLLGAWGLLMGRVMYRRRRV